MLLKLGWETRIPRRAGSIRGISTATESSVIPSVHGLLLEPGRKLSGAPGTRVLAPSVLVTRSSLVLGPYCPGDQSLPPLSCVWIRAGVVSPACQLIFLLQAAGYSSLQSHQLERSHPFPPYMVVRNNGSHPPDKNLEWPCPRGKGQGKHTEGLNSGWVPEER